MGAGFEAEVVGGMVFGAGVGSGAEAGAVPPSPAIKI